MKVYGKHVSNLNRAEEVSSHLLPRWEFIAGMSAIQIEPRRCRATYFLDWSLASILAIQIEPRKCIGTHKLDRSL
jgi:hypothetical protein